jgi:RNA polymerase sigma factor (sigma-70 family)
MTTTARSRTPHAHAQIRPAPESSDFDLLQQWVAGDRRSGDRLVRRYYMEITRFFMNAVGDQDRRELTQETFSQLCTAAARFGGISSFRSYLYGIARNVLNAFLRKRYRRAEIEAEFDPEIHTIEDAGSLTPSRLISTLVRREVIVQCLRELPVESKQMLELYYWHGLTADELGAMYRVPAPTIRTRLFHLRRKLANKIKKRQPQLGKVDIERQLGTLRQLLGFGPTRIDE